MDKKDSYLTILQLKSKLKQDIDNKNANKLKLISQYRKELSGIWPVIYKRQYFERFYEPMQKNGSPQKDTNLYSS